MAAFDPKHEHDHLPATFGKQCTRSPLMARLFLRVREIAKDRTPVVILGPSGVGKDEIAYALHALSGRPGQLVPLNAATLGPDLAARELFGAVSGAYTGAVTADGAVRAAHRGTLFLDEITELAPPVQAMLLRVIQDGRVRPVGGGTLTPVDVRWVVACNRDLQAEARAGRFREDLWYRLATGDVITVPPLKDRLEDLPMAVRAILAAHDLAQVRFDPTAMRALERYHWPGNFRELAGVVVRSARRRAVVTSGDLADFPVLNALSDTQDAPPGPSAIADALARAGGNRTAAARELGVSRSWLRRRLATDPGLAQDDDTEDAPSTDEVLRALGEVGGNRAAAARLLGVSRGFVQRRVPPEDADRGIDRSAGRQRPTED